MINIQAECDQVTPIGCPRHDVGRAVCTGLAINYPRASGGQDKPVLNQLAHARLLIDVGEGLLTELLW